ncbi:hypothetical protein AYI68_g1541 [Smittium mucronatum]|uniref:Uncharacterized protein n=1 Tax=Smittium mucronatum TaxID=133383 RepID=A0A1R0H557_9FUNG|nr:hypothetical protein AYI68_g3455 [Smittium mucronatum]OLY84305.1 hypothetical protein AYI68_g1541 [Smittium mucronatum]
MELSKPHNLELSSEISNSKGTEREDDRSLYYSYMFQTSRDFISQAELESAEYYESKDDELQNEESASIEQLNSRIRSLILSSISILESLCAPNIPDQIEALARWELARVYKDWFGEFEEQERNIQRSILLSPKGPDYTYSNLKMELSLIDLYIKNDRYSLAENRLGVIMKEAKS